MQGEQRAPQPSERRSTEYAYGLIRARILSGEIPPGSIVSQAQLAEAIGVSRTPLREATRLLQTEGLLEGEPNRRLRVAEVSVSDLEQLYALRITTESLAVRASVAKMDGSDLAVLRRAFDDMERFTLAGAVEKADVAHRQFHSVLVSGAGERFAAVSSNLWDHTIRYRAAAVTSATNVAEVLLVAQAEHWQILSAAAEGDADAAAAGLARHYERTARTLITATDPEHKTLLLDGALAAVGVAK